jgi:hypothetical protein
VARFVPARVGERRTLRFLWFGCIVHSPSVGAFSDALASRGSDLGRLPCRSGSQKAPFDPREQSCGSTASWRTGAQRTSPRTPPPGPHGFATWSGGAQRVRIEGHAPSAWATGLRERGHEVEVAGFDPAGFGHAHLIEVRADGIRAGAADPRSMTGAAVASA